jgi:hypothetical protein
MSFEELAAALEERLSFYKIVLDMMEKAVKTGDTEAITAYSKLEARTAKEIAAYRECFIARRGESSRSDEFARRTQAVMEDALAKSKRVQALLAKEKEAAAVQLQEIRRITKGTASRSGSPPPLVIDIEA